MNKRLLIVTVTAMALIFGFATVSVYAMDHGKTGCGKGQDHSMDFEKKFYTKAHMILENSEELGLSDDQIKKIKELKTNTVKDAIKKDAEIEILAIDIKAEMWADPLNVAAVNKLIDKKYDLKKEKIKSFIAAYASLKDMLTKDQKEKMKEIWKKCKGDKGGGMMKGMMKGPMNCPMMGDKR